MMQRIKLEQVQEALQKLLLGEQRGRAVVVIK
jgi:D-arabinose 1-dehydrogenase-like Zn-dependent alcohol dehydrogenase